MSVFRLFLAVLLAATLGACNLLHTDDADQLAQTDWLATSIDDETIVSPKPVTLSFSEGRGSGNSGCNYFSAAVEYGSGRIRFSNIISTKMACVEEGLMQLEARYLNALQGASSYDIGADGKLTLRGERDIIKFSPTPRQTRP